MDPAIPICPRCGAALRPEAPEGLCPVCLLVSADREIGQMEGQPEPGLADVSSAAPPAALGRIGNYELLEEIGRGGMGIVFRARQQGLNRIVAVKTILGGQFSGAVAIARFLSEAELAAQLQHPGIVTIHEVGQHEGQPFFSMDYVEGRNLAEMVREHPLPARTAARYLQAIAEAIHYAHQHGVLHRDLKPSNILIDQNDQPRVTDFGLAKRLTEDSELTLTGQTLGSPSYAAPEQVLGQRQRIGPPSDVYSLGAVLYHLLTRQPPFVADTLGATAGLVKDAQPVPVRHLNPTVPADLETICLKCLEKDPAQRYPTAAALAEDLARFVRSEPILARPVGWMGHLVRWCRRKPVIAMLLGGLIILALAIVVGSPVAIYRIQRARLGMEREAYYANIGLAKTYVDQGNIDQAMFILTNCPPQYRHWEWGHLVFLCHKDIASFQTIGTSNYTHLAFSPKGSLLLSLVRNPRNQQAQMQLWDYQARKEVFRWRVPTNQVVCAAFDPHGNRLAAGFSNGWLHVWKIESPNSADHLRDELREGPRLPVRRTQTGGAVPNTGSAARRPSQDGSRTSIMAVEPKRPSSGIQEPPVLSFLAHTGTVEQIEWSRDGHQLVSCGLDGRVRLWDMLTGRLAQDWAGPDPPLARLGFNRAQDRILAWNFQQFIAWDRLTGKEVQRESLDTREKVLLWPSPDADFFATSDVEGRLTLGPTVKNAKELVVARGFAASLDQRAFFSPDGKWLCNAGDQGTARLWRVADGHEQFTIPDRVCQVRFSTGSGLMATLGHKNDAVIWDVQTGQETLRLYGHSGLVQELKFSPDGRLVATLDQRGMIKLWASESGRELLPERDCVGGATLSPDGQHVALSASYRGLTIWDANSGELLTRIKGPLEYIYTIAFSPDGKRLVTAGSHRLLRLWDTDTWTHLATWSGHERWIVQAAFSRDGQWLFSYSLDGVLKLWEAATGKIHQSIVTGMAPLDAAAMSDDGRLLAAGSPQGLVKLWEVTTGKELATLWAHTNAIYAVAFSPDGTRLVASSTDGVTSIRDCRTGHSLATWAARGCDWPLAFSEDGRRLFTGTTRYQYSGHDNPKLVVRDTETGRELLSLDRAGMCTCLQYHGISRRLVTGSYDGFVRQFEAWPWREQDYPGEASSGLAQRIRLFADHYWSERLAAESRRSLPRQTNETLISFDWEPWLFPERDPKATPRQIDLRRFYTTPLTATPYPGWDQYGGDDDFRNLPRGLVTFLGITFDVRGVIQLGRFDPLGEPYRRKWQELPSAVRGIPVAQTCRRIHALHGVWQRAGEGEAIGSYLCHYADGQSHALDIRYGWDLRCRWPKGADPKISTQRSQLAWTGTNPTSTQLGRSVCLYLSSYDNPRPEVEITSIDFVSYLTQSAPFLIALTLE